MLTFTGECIFMKLLQYGIAFLIIYIPTVLSSAVASIELNIEISNGDEIIVKQFPAKGDYLVLWFSPAA